MLEKSRRSLIAGAGALIVDGRQPDTPALDRDFSRLSAPFCATKNLYNTPFQPLPSSLCPQITTSGNLHTTPGNLD